MRILSSWQMSNGTILTIVMALLLVAGIGLTSCGRDEEEEFPSEPISIISGWLGGTEQFLNAIAPEAEEDLDVPVMVVNKLGNEGLDAIREFQAAAPDGYTLLGILDLDAAAFAQGLIDVNPAEDEIPILIGNVAISQIYIRADESRYSDWDGLVAYATEHAALKVATIGDPFNLENLSLASLEQAFGVVFQQVPYDLSPERYESLVKGQTDLLIDQPGDLKEFLDSGQFKPILTLWNKRVNGFENVPVPTEMGVDFTPLLRIRGLAAPKDTPQDCIEELEEAFNDAFNSEAFQQHLSERMLDLVPYPEDPVAAMREQVELYQQLYEAFSASMIETQVGQEVTITLDSNATTGYRWQLAEPLDESILELVGSEYEPPEGGGIGAGGQELWTFRGVGQGESEIALKYVQPWEEDAAPAKERTFTVVVR
jgi:tripartite-type tricarboxylate transporter receptor subunit TctC